MNKKEIIKLRRHDRFASEAKHFHAAYLARKKIEELQAEKKLREYYEH